MKTYLSFACLLLVVCVVAEARPKRSVVISSPVLAAPAVVPVVRTAAVVHSHPTTVVKTEQVHAGDHSSYSYSTEVKSHPVVHAAAPVLHHAVPSYSYGHYPANYAYYSPYHYIVGK